MQSPSHAWMVRAGTENILADQVDEANAVAIGWHKMGNVSNLKTREAFKQRYREAFPDDSPGQVPINAGQVYRFTCEIQKGDYVLTYLQATRMIMIGLAVDDYEYDPSVFGELYPHIRRVEWQRKVSRDDFSFPARNSMGSSLTVFNLDPHLREIDALVEGQPEEADVAEAEEETPPFFDEVKAQADELVSDIISQLVPYEFQDLVAGVLRAMGFRAISSPPGRDGGIDIIAHPDALGFEEPRIKVQVKHRKDSIGGSEMRSFIGALRSGDRGMYVSTGGFTSDAKTAAENASTPITILDRDDFIRLMLEHYEQLDPEFRAVVPLRKIWVPIK